MKKLLKKIWLIVWIALPIIVTIAIFSGVIADIGVSKVHAEVSEPTIIDNTHKTADELKDELALLIRNGKDGKSGESGGAVIKDGDIFHTFDASKKMEARCMQNRTIRPIDCESYGAYQEKIGTIQQYAKQLYGRELTQMEAFAIANTEDKAKEFFLRCSIEIDGCVWNWSVAEQNRPYVEVVIPLIRKLQK